MTVQRFVKICTTSCCCTDLLFVSLQDGQLSRLEEELTRREADWLQSEAGLRSTVSSLEQELELQREQHSREVL